MQYALCFLLWRVIINKRTTLKASVAYALVNTTYDGPMAHHALDTSLCASIAILNFQVHCN